MNFFDFKQHSFVVLGLIEDLIINYCHSFEDENPLIYFNPTLKIYHKNDPT